MSPLQRMSVFQGYICKVVFHRTSKNIFKIKKLADYKNFSQQQKNSCLLYICMLVCICMDLCMNVFVTTLAIIDEPPPPYDVFNSWQQTSDHTPLQPIPPHSHYDNFCKLVKKNQLKVGESSS